MRSIFSLLIAGMLCALVAGCEAEGTAHAPQTRQLHLTVLPDLSDRLTRPKQVEKDKMLIDAMASFFYDLVAKRRFYIGSDDRFEVVPARQKDNPQWVDYSGHLGVYVDKILLGDRVRVLRPKLDTLLAYVDRLYEEATEAETYSGADIYAYFDEDLRYIEEVSSSGAPYGIKIVIPTDGWLYAGDRLFKNGNRANYIPKKVYGALCNNPNWRQEFDEKDYGFPRLNHQLSGDIDVLVIGLDPPGECFNGLAILEAFWSKWFEEMGLSPDRYMLVKNIESSEYLETIVSQFLNDRNASSPSNHN